MMKLTEKQISEKLQDIRGWSYTEETLHMQAKFNDFTEAFVFMTRVAFEAERLGHHPDWRNVYNRVAIHLSTHDEGGVTEKDFELAKFISELLGTP